MRPPRLGGAPYALRLARSPLPGEHERRKRRNRRWNDFGDDSGNEGIGCWRCSHDAQRWSKVIEQHRSERAKQPGHEQDGEPCPLPRLPCDDDRECADDRGEPDGNQRPDVDGIIPDGCAVEGKRWRWSWQPLDSRVSDNDGLRDEDEQYHNRHHTERAIGL